MDLGGVFWAQKPARLHVGCHHFVEIHSSSNFLGPGNIQVEETLVSRCKTLEWHNVPDLAAFSGWVGSKGLGHEVDGTTLLSAKGDPAHTGDLGQCSNAGINVHGIAERRWLRPPNDGRTSKMAFKSSNS